jgi:hypothetical protein
MVPGMAPKKITVCVWLKTDESSGLIGLLLFCSLRGRSSAEITQW